VAGYSGTPLAKKLGIRPNSRIWVVGAPPGYRQWLAPLPADVTIIAGETERCDIVHLFVDSLCVLDRELPKARQTMVPAGAIWVSWRKKSSGVSTDVTEDAVRSRALRTDLVDVKVCAVSEVWSGLKLVVRKHLR